MNTLKALGFSILGLLCFSHLRAQIFEAVDTLSVSGIENVSMKWVDLNNNLLYDLILYGNDTLGNGVLQVYLNEGQGKFTLQSASFPNVRISELQPIDYDRDRKIDLAFSGIVNGADTVVSVLLSRENFTFELLPTPVLSGPVEAFQFLDLNYDTVNDLLIARRSDEDSIELKVLKGTAPGFEDLMIEFPLFTEGGFFALDIDSDARKDLLLSGFRQGQSFTRLYKNNGSFEFVDSANFGFEYEQIVQESDTSFFVAVDHQVEAIALGEYDGNRRPDVFVRGKSSMGEDLNVLYRNNGGRIVADQDSMLRNYKIQASHMADFDSDGKTDLWLSASRNDSTFVFWYNNLNAFAEAEPVYRDSLLLTEFADWDLDFNLDFVELRQARQGMSLIFFENQADSINKAPSLPFPQSAVQTAAGEVKISWQAALDSLTDSTSLSYDFLLTDADTAALFDSNMSAKTFSLQQPNHGKALYADHLNFNDLAQGNYLFLVIAVDNAYNALGTGTLQLFNFAICDAELVASSVELCPGTPELFGEQGIKRNWYSDLYGALGQTDLLAYSPIGADVLYGTVADVADCGSGQLVYNITTKPLDSLSADIDDLVQVCEESEITYELPDTWTNVIWSSAALGTIGEGSSLTFAVTQADTISVVAANEFGCFDRAESVIAFFDPQVSDTLITISPGESADITAFGGQAYEWSPANEFDDPFNQKQTVSPDETTDYQVLVKNDAGCERLFNIRVEVGQLGGVANLFSPNGDNRNDQFFLQLSTVPATIDFRVYARSGGLIYQELDVARAVSEGWDGTHKGEKMPPGVYYWRVEGTYSDGRPVLLNGKKSGKINLVR
ncbi:gliding motility-associated C-terminal domain-containing protein [uncultured Imperialibacter sp.]|uniref:T9SS type B sorting domain-containing protein n=1 Tax=uncultured Imperialibacter sp. TaxID=1672639 RepID=UPI0030DD4777|tara:strand:- start:40775 stop:43294 length:2520 start_codon:yes stop_codon:yes gene_type:complete